LNGLWDDQHKPYSPRNGSTTVTIPIATLYRILDKKQDDL
jgi:hypothetical protein